MSFEILKSIEKRGKTKGEPAYIEFIKEDKNPLAGTIKKRLISSPNKAMHAINVMFYALLRFKFEKDGVKFPFCTAVFPGSKPLKNVLKHTNAKNRYFYLIDIKDFYPSVKIHHVVQTTHTNQIISSQS
jgi:hypothetical protein